MQNATPRQPDDMNRPETEADGYIAAELRIARQLRNNPRKRDEILAKMRARRKG